jgi:cytochrome c oxidase subunit 4
MSVHVSSVRLYVAVFLALMAFTALTIWAAFIDLGPLNNLVALGIAVTKAVLVILYFMHVRTSTRLTAIVVASGFFWLAVLLVLTYSDYATRGLLGVPGK